MRNSKSDPDIGPMWPDWMRLAFDAATRVATARTYAIRVFGKETAAAVWMGRASPAVLGGDCIIAEACESPDGFLEAMAELARFERAKA